MHTMRRNHEEDGQESQPQITKNKIAKSKLSGARLPNIFEIKC